MLAEGDVKPPLHLIQAPAHVIGEIYAVIGEFSNTTNASILVCRQ